MPQTPHVEKHFTGGLFVRDIVIGMSDGQTVPFALAAGLSGAVSSNAIVVTAGLAEIAAGSIAMGLGGYLAAKSDVEHYESERAREKWEVEHEPDEEAREVADIFEGYGIPRADTAQVITALRKNPKAWLEVLMRLELGLEMPDPRRALTSALTIAGAYIAGGAVPLAPYIFAHNLPTALIYSVIVTLLALLIFGALKGRFTGASPIRSGMQTLIVGGLAAGAAFGIAKLIS